MNVRWLGMALALALLAAVLAFLITDRLGGNDAGAGIDGETTRGERVASTTGTTAPAAQDYVQFADGLGEGRLDESTTEPTDIADGLRKLAGALGALGLGSPDLPVDLRVTAEHLLLNPAAPATTQAVRTALIEAAAAIGMTRPDAAATLRQSAEAVNIEVPVVNQQATLRNFFRRAAEAIARISGEPQSRKSAS